MQENDVPCAILRFGCFELQCETGELRQSGALIRISDQTFRLLKLFCVHAGQIVTREDIREALWGDRTFVNFERSINFSINQLRIALGDSAQKPRYLETLPKRGYRFIAAVEKRLNGQPAGLAPAPLESVAVLPFTNTAADPEISWLGWAICESVGVDLHKLTHLGVVGADRIAKVLSGMGLRELGDKDVPIFAAALRAKWIVWGGYQRIGSKLRITACLTRAETGEMAGSAKIDGRLDEIFQMEDQVVTELLDALSINLSDEELSKIRRAETTSLQAYEYYAKGRQQFLLFGTSGLEAARQLYEKAVAIHPHYALANCGLGSAYIFRFIATSDPRDLEIGIGYLRRATEDDSDVAEAYRLLSYAYLRSARFDDSLASADRAAKLDPSNHMSHYHTGSVYLCRAAFEYKTVLFREALPHFRKAIALEPHYAWSHLHTGWILMVHGWYAEAYESFNQAAIVQDSAGATRAGTRLQGSRTLMGVLLMRQGDLAAAEEAHRRSLAELAECDHVYRRQLMACSRYGLGDVAFRTGHFEAALDLYKRAEDLLAQDSRGLGLGHFTIQAWFRLAKALIALERVDEAMQHMERAQGLLNEKAGFDFNFIWEGWDAQSCYDWATCNALLGSDEDALTCLEKAVACGWADARLLSTDPVFNALRKRASFGQLVTMIPKPIGVA